MLDERYEQDLREAEIPENFAEIKELAENLKLKKDEREQYIKKLTQDFEMLENLKNKAELENKTALALIKEREAREKEQFELLVLSRGAYHDILRECGFERYAAREVSPEINNLREKRSELIARRAEILSKLEGLKKYVKIFEETERAYAAVKQLSGAADAGLESYAHSALFGRVLSAANIRLKIMSRERYALINVGAELEVFDGYTGKKRGVGSLSGGESFLASLSLALGLSDIIRKSGANLEAMFIDEGFGSLDGEAAELAMRVLSDIAESGAVIGIISHVPELRELISKQVYVKKTSAGSYIK
jgi:exonuclease SbcC